MTLIFALFFLLPLVFVVIVSAWDYNEYEMIPGVQPARLHRHVRRLHRRSARIVHDLENLSEDA